MAFNVEQKTLDTVSDYISDARTLLLDTISPFRYDDPSLLIAFNVALLEGRRLRADLFVFNHKNVVPSFSAVSGDVVHIEPQFRLGFLYGLCAHALLRDQEDVQDARASTLMNGFYQILTGKSAPAVSGGTPQGKQG